MKTTEIIKRTLGLVPFMLITLVGVSVLYCKYILNFIRFGGEAIAYTNKNERKTIRDVYNILEKEFRNEKG